MGSFCSGGKIKVRMFHVSKQRGKYGKYLSKNTVGRFDQIQFIAASLLPYLIQRTSKRRLFYGNK